MPHYGILSLTATGHLNPMCALGRALARRGNRVTHFQIPEVEPVIRAAGLGFVAIGASDYPPGEIGRQYARLGQLKGVAALKWTIGLMRRRPEMSLREAPAAIRAAGIDALLVDQASPEGGTVAEILGLPQVTVANALLLNGEPGIPPFSTAWRYRDAAWARLRNRAAYFAQDRLVAPLRGAINARRREAGLAPLADRSEFYSRLAQVGQIPFEFDFPRANLPDCFHYTGPFSDAEGRQPVPFPFEKLDGRPLIYASMGTLQNRLTHVFEAIAGACAGLDAQLVLSLGGSAEPGSLPTLPGSPLVVKYAPQLDLVARARLVITHAGLNTTMETLSHGAPMVAIPVANDQPGVAARIAHSGAGEIVPLARLSAARLRPAVLRVFSDPSYVVAARRLQDAIRRAGGADRAAEIIDRAIATGRPVVDDRRPSASSRR